MLNRPHDLYDKFHSRRKKLLITTGILATLGIGFIIASWLMPYEILIYYIANTLIIGAAAVGTLGFLVLIKAHDNYIEAQNNNTYHSEQYKLTRKIFVTTIGLFLACSAALMFSCIFVSPMTAVLLRIGALILSISTFPIGIFGLLCSLDFASKQDPIVPDTNALTDIYRRPDADREEHIVEQELQRSRTRRASLAGRMNLHGVDAQPSARAGDLYSSAGRSSKGEASHHPIYGIYGNEQPSPHTPLPWQRTIK